MLEEGGIFLLLDRLEEILLENCEEGPVDPRAIFGHPPL
jgi:hypothetical protein